jgi:hypothetical protein
MLSEPYLMHPPPPQPGFLLPTTGAFYTGGSNVQYNIDVSEWTPFGTGGYIENWTTTTGDTLALFGNPLLGLPDGYVSGNALSGSGSLSGGSFANAGITEGTFTTTLTNGVNSDTITITTQAIPEPSSALLLGLGALGLVARRKRIN